MFISDEQRLKDNIKINPQVAKSLDEGDKKIISEILAILKKKI